MNLIQNRKLAEEINKKFPISPETKEAISKTNRELFVSSGFKHLSYKLDALPMSADQWISSPLTVAKMTEYLKVKDADSVLEIGCGSGYQAAVLSLLIRRVFSIERIEKLLNEARSRIKIANIENVHTKLDDGQKGWREFAPFDRILFSASISEIPKAIFDQLNDNGILLAPIIEGDKQIITRYTKTKLGIKKECLEECIFVPVLDGIVI